MGILDMVKTAKNFMTVGGARLSLEIIQPRLK
jgi:hypothetical protein